MSGGYKASAIGFSLVLSIIIGGGLGYWLATVTGHNYWFFIGLILGIIAAPGTCTSWARNTRG